MVDIDGTNLAKGRRQEVNEGCNKLSNHWLISALDVATNVLHILVSSCVRVLVKGIHCVMLDGGL